jgi:hypothetical protein
MTKKTGRGLTGAMTLATLLIAGCSRLKGLPEAPIEPSATSTSTAAPIAASNVAKPASQASPTGAKSLVGPGSIALFDTLPAADRAHLREVKTLYLHQSVGQDLEDGAEANGFKFEYFGPDTTSLAAGLNGGIFTDVGNVPNGEPLKKMDVVRTALKRSKGTAKVVSFSFGYADIRDQDLAQVQGAYTTFVGEVKKTGAVFVHVTPPLVFSAEENPPKMKFRNFMLNTFKDDVIFDLADIESQEAGKRCEVGGVWRICPSIRSTTLCPSKGQGIDGDSAGHICEKRAKEISKAMLYAFAIAARR